MGDLVARSIGIIEGAHMSTNLGGHNKCLAPVNIEVYAPNLISLLCQ